MSEDLLAQAAAQRRHGDWREAIERCREALTLDPGHAVAHASLAVSLLGARRFVGARAEARQALALDASHPFVHHAAAAVALADGKLTAALAHVQIALTDADAEVRVLAAEVRMRRGELREARALLDEVLALAPTDLPALVAAARLELADGNTAAAKARIDLVLGVGAARIPAHVTAGRIALAAGDAAAAEGHARHVLERDATDPEGLALWTALKARRSPLLGLWWRFHVKLTTRSDRGQIVMLLGGFFAIRLLVILARHFDLLVAAHWLSLAWLGFCAYTWIAPRVFAWMLASDLGAVKLDDADY